MTSEREADMREIIKNSPMMIPVDFGLWLLDALDATRKLLDAERLSERHEALRGAVEPVEAELRKHADMLVSLGDNAAASAFLNPANDLAQALTTDEPEAPAPGKENKEGAVLAKGSPAGGHPASAGSAAPSPSPEACTGGECVHTDQRHAYPRNQPAQAATESGSEQAPAPGGGCDACHPHTAGVIVQGVAHTCKPAPAEEKSVTVYCKECRERKYPHEHEEAKRDG